jgi:thiaminase
MLDRLGEALGASARYPRLLTTFVAATRLETAFWDMGWRAGKAFPSQSVARV